MIGPGDILTITIGETAAPTMLSARVVRVREGVALVEIVDGFHDGTLVNVNLSAIEEGEEPELQP